eukprot:538910-Pleurochrysis_carterae.AAC.1
MGDFDAGVLNFPESVTELFRLTSQRGYPQRRNGIGCTFLARWFVAPRRTINTPSSPALSAPQRPAKGTLRQKRRQEERIQKLEHPAAAFCIQLKA